MNKTKIEWCDSTWNPVTGCYHGCPYCYARNMINRFGKAEYGKSAGEMDVLELYDPIKDENGNVKKVKISARALKKAKIERA